LSWDANWQGQMIHHKIIHIEFIIFNKIKKAGGD
jgi:hypothetical protein